MRADKLVRVVRTIVIIGAVIGLIWFGLWFETTTVGGLPGIDIFD